MEQMSIYLLPDKDALVLENPVLLAIRLALVKTAGDVFRFDTFDFDNYIHNYLSYI